MNEIDFGNNQFCGPSVLSAITGINTDEAAAVIQSVTGSYKPVRGVLLKDLMQAFRQLGYKTIEEPWVGSSVFSALYSLHGKDGNYVFMVPGHFIAIESNGNHKYICDNHTKSPINVSSSARLGMKVAALFRVEKVKIAEPIPQPLPEKPQPIIARLEILNGIYSVRVDGMTIGTWTYLEGAMEAMRKAVITAEENERIKKND